MPAAHPLADRDPPPSLDDLVGEALVVFPRTPRPSFADVVLSLYRERGLRPGAVSEVRELQTALGLVVAGEGIALVPASVQRLRRDDVVYRPLVGEKAVAPVIMSHRMNDGSPEIDILLDLIYDMYRANGIPHEPRR